jgi:protein-tyrosine phosphatase
VPEIDPLAMQLAALFEADAAGAARGALDGEPFSILTVCTGNICRSPLAEALLQRELHSVALRLGRTDDGAIVASSGLGALVGSGVDPAVLAIGAEFGVGLEGHVARQFAPEHAESAHLILTATRTQRDEAIALAPAAATRCFTLNEFARLLDLLGGAGSLEPPTAPMHRPARINRRLQRVVRDADAMRQRQPASDADDIDDPYRRSSEVHRRVASQIRDACAVIGSRLRATIR